MFAQTILHGRWPLRNPFIKEDGGLYWGRPLWTAVQNRLPIWAVWARIDSSCSGVISAMKRDAGKKRSSQAHDTDATEGWPYEVLKRFRMVFKAVQQHSQWVETRCGVTSAQLWALWELSRKPGLRVSELANAMSIHHSTASNLLDKLARRGLIKRERVREDRRVVTLSLTPEGIELIERAPSPAQGLLQHALFRLPDAVLQSLAQDLDALVNEMEIKDDEAAMRPLNPLAKAIRQQGA